MLTDFDYTFQGLRDACKEANTFPRMHGNGFIQLDPYPDRRVHIWPDPKPVTQAVNTFIHNHTFGFVSQILFGRMANIVYDIFYDREGDYVLHEVIARQGEDTQLVPMSDDIGTPARVDVRIRYTQLLERDSVYQMEPFTLHESAPLRGPVMTALKKNVTLPGYQPRVLCPVGQKFDNAYSRYSWNADELWQMIWEICEVIRKDVESREN